MEIPKTRKLCDAERFCVGLKLLAEECNMKIVHYCKLCVYKYEFKDGSSVGCNEAHREAGLIVY